MTNIEHDEHNGFDVLGGSEICMCPPYLRHVSNNARAGKRTVSAMRQEIVRVELATLITLIMMVECYLCETT